MQGQKICFKKKFQSCYRVEGPNIQSLIIARWGFGTTNKAIPEDLRLLPGSYGVSIGEKRGWLLDAGGWPSSALKSSSTILKSILKPSSMQWRGGLIGLIKCGCSFC